MEVEYKWNLSSSINSENIFTEIEIPITLLEKSTIQMSAKYYDTDDEVLKNNQGALRLRKENDLSVCCLKLKSIGNGNCVKREEYEVVSDNIFEGINKLSQSGAPVNLCQLLIKKKVKETCFISFLRKRMTVSIKIDNFEATVELAFDEGFFEHETRKTAFSDFECEYVNGDEIAFHAFAKKLESNFKLVPQNLPKIARALQV